MRTPLGKIIEISDELKKFVKDTELNFKAKIKVQVSHSIFFENVTNIYVEVKKGKSHKSISTFGGLQRPIAYHSDEYFIECLINQRVI